MGAPRKAYAWSCRLGSPPPRSGDASRACVEVGECRPPHRSTKDTRHWCKGRVGIPHAWEWRRYSGQVYTVSRFGEVSNCITEERVCFGCGKLGDRLRSYCRQCGEPWPWERTCNVNDACARCGAPHRMARRSAS